MGPRVLREDLVPLPLGPPQEELLAPPEQDLGGPVLAPGLQRLLHNQSFSFKGHRLVTSEAKGDKNKRDVCCFKHAIEATCVEHNILDLPTHA